MHRNLAPHSEALRSYHERGEAAMHALTGKGDTAGVPSVGGLLMEAVAPAQPFYRKLRTHAGGRALEREGGGT